MKFEFEFFPANFENEILKIVNPRISKAGGMDSISLVIRLLRTCGQHHLPRRCPVQQVHLLRHSEMSFGLPDFTARRGGLVGPAFGIVPLCNDPIKSVSVDAAHSALPAHSARVVGRHALLSRPAPGSRPPEPSRFQFVVGEAGPVTVYRLASSSSATLTCWA